MQQKHLVLLLMITLEEEPCSLHRKHIILKKTPTLGNLSSILKSVVTLFITEVISSQCVVVVKN